MLVELRIKNFAIIDSLVIELAGGFNVFTGETGAGKSIIMNAIALVLGDRAAADLVRTGAPGAEVEALFDVSGMKGICQALEEAGIEPSGDLVIKRVIARAGRNRIYINGSLATLVTLTEITRNLIDIYSQSEHQSLTRTEEHLDVLDSFGGLVEMRREMEGAYDEYMALLTERDSITRGSDGAAARRELLAYLVREIEEAALSTGEDEELRALRERLVNAEKIKGAAARAEEMLYSESGSVTERLGAIIRDLGGVSSFDETIGSALGALESSLYQIEDAAATLRDLSQSVEFEPGRLEEVEDRIYRIGELKKKYGPTIEAIGERREKMEAELAGLDDLDERLAAIDAMLVEKEKKARETAARLTTARQEAARGLKKRMEEELSTLGMEGAVFEVLMKTEKDPATGKERLSARGAERVAFYISTNPGEEIKPLSRVASGGELSRIMLAIKNISAAGRVPTLIFDEIDTGIGGAMAHVVGEKLKALSRTHQVLCITHLPQIAAFADEHFVVQKETAGAAAAAEGAEGEGSRGRAEEETAKAPGPRTVTSVRRLGGDEHVEQIAWMLGGVNVTDTTREHARELVRRAGGHAP
jgi:DNA repair protein RecN (Recombination protein N)